MDSNNIKPLLRCREHFNFLLEMSKRMLQYITPSKITTKHIEPGV